MAVTLLDANHCPGASLLLFRVGGGEGKKDGAVYHLHTGRWRPGAVQPPLFLSSQGQRLSRGACRRMQVTCGTTRG